MKAIHKKIFSVLVLSMLFGFALVPQAWGQTTPPAATNPGLPSVSNEASGTVVNAFTGFEAGNVQADPRTIIKRVINVVMGFLGMVAVIIILAAGFRWMTAGGNKENMEAAQKMLVNGVIGLVIIFSAWTVAWFAVNSIKLNVAG
ncbi:hypothetical protein HYW94_00450 [Candidatus Uhrbacteria bacterium]|nr:hypothetical protein [Candidatus Uhrbacteria bacterium]